MCKHSYRIEKLVHLPKYLWHVNSIIIKFCVGLRSMSILPSYQVNPSSALPKRTENGLHHISTVSYFDRSVSAGIS
jgi:hypothetical protein